MLPEFKVKVEMRQGGARQEAGKVGGVGSCGRVVLCHLADRFQISKYGGSPLPEPVNQPVQTQRTMWPSEMLPELRAGYLPGCFAAFSRQQLRCQGCQGKCHPDQEGYFQNLMWYVLSDSTKAIPLSIETVPQDQGRQPAGHLPEAWATVEVTSSKPREVEPEFVDVGGPDQFAQPRKNRPQAPPAANKRRSNGSREAADRRKATTGTTGPQPAATTKGQQPQQRGQQQKDRATRATAINSVPTTPAAAAPGRKPLSFPVLLPQTPVEGILDFPGSVTEREREREEERERERKRGEREREREERERERERERGDSLLSLVGYTRFDRKI